MYPTTSDPASMSPTVHPVVAGPRQGPSRRVRVNGREVFVHAVWVNSTADYRDLREPASLASFEWSADPTNPAFVEIELDVPVESAVVRPVSLGVRPTVRDGVVCFTLDRPGRFLVQFDGGRDVPLWMFADPVPPVNDDASRSAGDTAVRHFGAGVYDAGLIDLKSGETLHLSAGAFVNGVVRVRDAEGVTIRGRGILHGGAYLWTASDHRKPPLERMIVVQDSQDVRIEGLTLLDPFNWAIQTFRSRNVLVENVKTLGWRRNSVGVAVCNSDGVTVRDCFIVTQDDGVAVKGVGGGRRACRDVTIERTSVWNNWMRSFVVGGETRADIIEGVTFRDCDVMHAGINPRSPDDRDAALAVWNVDSGTIRDVRFEAIRLESVERLARVAVVESKHSADAERGVIRDVIFRDISVADPSAPGSIVTGYDDEHDVRGVRFENIDFAGRIARSPEDLGLRTNGHTRDVTVSATR